MNITLNRLMQNKPFRFVLVILTLIAGGGVLAAINSLVGFSYAGNSAVAIVGHIVGTMIWGAIVAAVVRWAKL